MVLLLETRIKMHPRNVILSSEGRVLKSGVPDGQVFGELKKALIL